MNFLIIFSKVFLVSGIAFIFVSIGMSIYISMLPPESGDLGMLLGSKHKLIKENTIYERRFTECKLRLPYISGYLYGIVKA